MMKIYIFGNLLVKNDSLPLKLLPKLKELYPKIDFIITDPNENFPPSDEKDLVILDTVLGIDEPMLLDLDDFEKKDKTPISPHDYDLLFSLFLLKKMKKIKKVRIIGIPTKVKDQSFMIILKLIDNLSGSKTKY